MEILILIAVIVTGASGLYVAYTFKKHVEQDVTPLMQHITQEDRSQIEEMGKGLEQRIQTSIDQVASMTGKGLVTNEAFKQQIEAITGELRYDRALVRSLTEKIDALEDRLGQAVARADDRVIRIGESLARQSVQLTAIHNYAKSQEKQTGTAPETGRLTVAVLEVESQVDVEGWGIPPRLYALTERIPSASAGHDHPAEMPGALIPVAHEPLPDGDLVEALANVRWPEDVVGCVLVAELTDLPAGSEQDAPIDPVAAGQWTSTSPDGRPARLVIGVHRNGEHVCGFRAKGDDDVQIRTDMAVGGIVTALLGTF